MDFCSFFCFGGETVKHDKNTATQQPNNPTTDCGPAECAKRFNPATPRSVVIKRGQGLLPVCQQTDFVSPGALRIPPGRAGSRAGHGLLGPKTAFKRLQFGQVASKLPSRRPQDGIMTASSTKLPPSCLQDAFKSHLDPNFGSTRPSLGPPEGQSDL